MMEALSTDNANEKGKVFSLVLSSDKSARYISQLLDAKELENLMLSEYLASVLDLAERFDIHLIYFEGGTLVVDEYSVKHQHNSVYSCIKLMTQNSHIVTNIRVAKVDVIRSYLNDKHFALMSGNREINAAESLLMFGQLMERAVELNSEDVYISLSETGNVSYAQFKVEGELHPETFPLKDYAFGKSMCQAVYDGKDGVGKTVGFFDDVTTPQERQISHKVYDEHGNLQEKLNIRFTKTTTARAGELLVNMRVQKKARRLYELGLDEDTIRLLKSTASKTKGAMLVSGRTGSGKSTTNFAMLLDIPRSKSVQTFEDPIEIEKPREYTNIYQNSLDKKLGMKAQLSAILRMAPDVLFIQEVRDHDTADFLFHVLKTGFFGLASIHASSAVGIVDRLVDLGITLKDIASPEGLSLLLHQTLIRKLCPHCKVPLIGYESLSSSNAYVYKQKLMQLKEHGVDIEDTDSLNDLYARNMDGCEHCNGMGEMGRQLILEKIEVKNKDREFILAGDLMGWTAYLKAQGFRTASEQAMDLMKSGLVDIARVSEITLE